MPIKVPFGDQGQQPDPSQDPSQAGADPISMGLQQILQTQDINEAHQIAQALLQAQGQEEGQEAAAPQGAAPGKPSLDDQINAVMAKK